MLIGILSDSHGRYRMVRQAMGLFDSKGVDIVVHCGDVGDIGVFDEMAGRDVRFVWGNTDDPTPVACAHLKVLGIAEPKEAPLDFEVNGKRIMVYHGHERGINNPLMMSDVSYVIHGHTHEKRDERIEHLRVINPGAVHRTPQPSVAVLDPDSDELTFYDLEREG